MYIYFARNCCSNGFIKIGKAKNVDYRLEELQVGTPYELKLIYKYKFESESDSIFYEKKLHKLFKCIKVRGEWFQQCNLLRNFIALLASGSDITFAISLVKNSDSYIEKLDQYYKYKKKDSKKNMKERDKSKEILELL